MHRSLRSLSRLWLVWVALLVAFIVLRPTVFSLVFWILAIGVAAATLAQMIDAYKAATLEQETIDALRNRLFALGAIVDVEDEDDVFEWLNAQQWEDVFSALQKMPAGSRSLRQAVLTTHPRLR